MKRRTSLVRSENLTVVFTDIVGFTKTTSSQSREANASMLERHNKLLLPIARKFGGRQVKSIGDSLLLVFRSSTDALLCCMAMQDALFEYNSRRGPAPAIHIRAAVNVGEVRVTQGDVFGEAVNIAARLEGITPADRIYLTHAVYMTMNRAEVPVEEVGVEQFKGIDEPVQVFEVPQFSSTRLVVEHPIEGAGPGGPREGFAFPYGGVHLMDFSDEPNKRARPPAWLWGALAALLLVLAAAAWWLWSVRDSTGTAGSQAPRLALPGPGALPPPVGPGPGQPLFPPFPGPANPAGPGPGAAPAPPPVSQTLEDLAPWLLDQRWFISPERLTEAPLPLGSPPVEDKTTAGLLAIPWSEVSTADQALLAAVEPHWAQVPPRRQRRLLDTAKLWRSASPAQRRAVLAELDKWRGLGGGTRGFASRRLDYLRSLSEDKRWQLIEQHGLALSLDGGSGPADGRSGDEAGVAPVGVEVKPPPPRNIWDPPPGQWPPPRQSEPDRQPFQGQARRPPSDSGYPPPPGDFDRYPPPPPFGDQQGFPPPPPDGGFGRGRPPPPWQRDGNDRPPFPPPR